MSVCVWPWRLKAVYHNGVFLVRGLPLFSTFVAINCFHLERVGNTKSCYFLRQREYCIEWHHLLFLQLFCDCVIGSGSEPHFTDFRALSTTVIGWTLIMCLADGSQYTYSHVRQGSVCILWPVGSQVVLALAPSWVKIVFITSLSPGSVCSRHAGFAVFPACHTHCLLVMGLASPSHWHQIYPHGHPLPWFICFLNIPFSLHSLSWFHSFS